MKTNRKKTSADDSTTAIFVVVTHCSPNRLIIIAGNQLKNFVFELCSESEGLQALALAVLHDACGGTIRTKTAVGTLCFYGAIASTAAFSAEEMTAIYQTYMTSFSCLHRIAT